MVAEFRYAIDAEHLTVWLEPLATGGTERAGVLCRRHADAMVVPLGWMLDDRRTQAPQLFRTNRAASPAPVDRPRRPRVAATVPDEVLQLSLDTIDDASVESVVVVDHEPMGEAAAVVAEPAQVDDEAVPPTPDDDPDQTQVMPWRPVFDQSDDLDGLLMAQSPLLRRAFGRERPAGS